MKPIIWVFAVLSVAAMPSLASAYEFRGVVGYDCSGKPELAKQKYAECTSNIRSAQGAGRCADVVANVYCKKVGTESAVQNNKLSLK